MASSGEIKYSALTKASVPSASIEPSPPDYEWAVSSEVGSVIDASSGAYTAGENEIGYQVTDIITVIDHANADVTISTEVLVTYGEITFIFPSTLLASRWIPTLYQCLLLGENLNIDIFSTALNFEPSDDITPVCNFGFGDFMLFTVLLNPNPVTDGVNIMLDTNGELAVANNMPLSIGMLPWILDDKNSEIDRK